jgi:GNAT superfamily N-acetyltransferase
MTGFTPYPLVRPSSNGRMRLNQKVRALQHSIKIRALERADLSAIAGILGSVDLFPPEMLAPLAEPYLAGDAPHHWLVACHGETILGFAYAEPERMTDGTFNLLAIAVDAASQRSGTGRAIVGGLEDRLRGKGARVLIVETSALEAFAGTRAFYAHQGYAEEARLRDFYTEGEDKVVYWKHL